MKRKWGDESTLEIREVIDAKYFYLRFQFEAQIILHVESVRTENRKQKMQKTNVYITSFKQILRQTMDKSKIGRK